MHDVKSNNPADNGYDVEFIPIRVTIPAASLGVAPWAINC